MGRDQGQRGGSQDAARTRLHHPVPRRATQRDRLRSWPHTPLSRPDPTWSTRLQRLGHRSGVPTRHMARPTAGRATLGGLAQEGARRAERFGRPLERRASVSIAGRLVADLSRNTRAMLTGPAPWRGWGRRRGCARRAAPKLLPTPGARVTPATIRTPAARQLCSSSQTLLHRGRTLSQRARRTPSQERASYGPSRPYYTLAPCGGKPTV
jgi:hypothetical protein